MRGAEEADAVPPGAWLALAVAALGFVLVGFNSTATNIAFADINDTFDDVSATTVSWIAAGYFIASGAFLPLGGRLADRRGRKRIFLTGLALFSVSAVASAIAPSIWFLIAARVLQALAGALVVPASLTLALPAFPASRRTSAIGLWSAAGPLSAAIAPTLVAELLAVTSWRWVYFVTAPAAGLLLLLGLTVHESSVAQPEGHLDLFGAALATAGIALMVVAVSQSVEWGVTASVVIAAVGAGILMLFVRRTLAHPHPLLNLSLLRIREVWVANLANAFISVVALSIWLVWPLYLSQVWDYSTAGVGRGLTVGPVAAGLSVLVFSRLADQHGTRSFIRLGTALQFCSLLWAVVFLGPEPAYWTEFAPALVLFGVGWGMTTPLLNSLALSAVEERYWAETNAGFNTMRFVAAAIGTAGAIAIIGDPDRVDLAAAYDRTFLFFTVWIALAGVVVFLFLPSGAGIRRPAVTAPTASAPPARTSPPPRPSR